MKLTKSISIWWGPPKDFDSNKYERRISWLELFFDLVYVVAISQITHRLAHHLNIEGFLENICLFTLIFWGWLNGSFHHDLHGNQGLRTRLMMLWQMMIIAAIAITLKKTTDDYKGVTILFMIMQLYITYQWWSVGLYDKSHRQYNIPYTILFLISFFLMSLTLYISHYWLKVIFPLILLCNYAPPFISHRILVRTAKTLDLSSSMFERMGLFTIIIFGELVIGVVNGISEIKTLHFIDWINFTLAISVVFSMWWIFFTFVSSRKVKRGFDKASLLELMYIPALIALGFVAASLSSFFIESEHTNGYQRLFGFGVAAFLFCIYLIMDLLVYPDVFKTLKYSMRLSLLFTAALFLILSLINYQLSITTYLIMVESILIIEIAFLNYVYYKQLLLEGIDPSEV
ncbi:MAG TPA: low temperature requirement protein A [Flavobacterium sp.]|nr:low temperature requirement protein A [Flavobacterium sp.]